ncbi:MAG: 4-hydroxy-3-methylbut-2-enyl diphosphate reductase [Lachnospiraceae bacterium]|nr:4-hydroxy-3-methylbut-2-enyl diphosphate reductase [Lachnospiraceae bacterium]
MEVIVAKSAGFCFGVKRAVDMVFEEAKNGGDIYTYGPIIHNESVVKELSEKGVRVLNSRDELEKLTSGTVIIRSHGVEKEIYDIIRKKGLKLVDATCPFVLKIHKTVEAEAQKGSNIVITGDREHPEVKGIISFAGKKVTVINSVKEADIYVAEDEKPVCVVSQTTFNVNKFKDIIEIFKKKEYSVNVVNTICSATQQRQEEAKNIASKADCMIVIGGASSSNSRKLYEICQGLCDNTVFVQTLEDLVSQSFSLSRSSACVGITAGASTPNYIIEEVQRYVRGNDI